MMADGADHHRLAKADEGPNGEREWVVLGLLSEFLSEVEGPISEHVAIEWRHEDKIKMLFELAERKSGGEQEWLVAAVFRIPFFLVARVVAATTELDTHPVFGSFGNAVTALRLLHPGEVKLSGLVCYPLDGGDRAIALVRRLAEFPDKIPTTQEDFSYHLQESDFLGLTTLFRTLECERIEPSAIRALSHFNAVYELDTNVDRLWRCWAGLEALYWNGPRDRGKTPSEVCSWRASKVIGADERQLRESYVHTRSGTIHGSHHPRAVNPETVEMIEDVLRRSLRRAIEEPGAVDRVRELYPLGDRNRSTL